MIVLSRIGLLLEHDHPLPKHLLTSSSTGRYSPVLTRKAASKVSELLKNWSEFCLLENHTYISFIRGESDDQQPTSFYVIRVTSKPPCLVVWLAFLAGTTGSVRHGIMLELYEKLKQLTVRQRICWKDIPRSKIKPAAPSLRSDLEDDGDPEDEDNVNLTTKAHPVPPASQFSDVFCCVLLSKPVEKILVRYESAPVDFSDPLGPGTKRSTSPNLLGGPESQQKIQSRNASVAFLTLSRYLNHKRWIWSLQSSPGYAISTTAVGRILNTLCKIRIQEGFTFAHSSKGIQNMVLEVPMMEEEQQQQGQQQLAASAASPKTTRSSPNCVVQYIIFPPHMKSTCSTTEESISEEDSLTEPAKDSESGEAHGEVQIITELWTEPQDGISLLSEPNNCHLSGRSSRDLSAVFLPRDLECVSTLITFEHLYMICDNAALPPPLTTIGGNLLPQLTDTDLSVPLPPLTSNSSIEHVPFAFDLLALLPKSHQTEMIFSLLLQDLGHCLSDSHLSMFPGIKPLTDKPNHMLFETLMKELKEISDRELPVPVKDCQQLPTLIGRRQSADFKFQNTVGQPSHTPRHSNSFSSHLQRGLAESGGGPRRFPSGASVSSSLADTLRDLHSHLDSSDAELFSGHPKWRCFIKAISPTHLVFTLLPATYEDLKMLTLNDQTLSGALPNIIDIVSKALPVQSHELVANLDEVSINSSIPNLEAVVGGRDTSGHFMSPRLEHTHTATFSRQRSGSDVFEMNRPKIPPVRKTSGDPGTIRARTSSLDGFSQFKAKALRIKNQLMEAEDRDRLNSTTDVARNSSGRLRRPYAAHGVSEVDSMLSSLDPLMRSSPLESSTPSSSKNVVGSLSLPIYIYDCNVSRLTSSLLFGDIAEKPKNYYQHFLFKPEVSLASTGTAQDRIQLLCKDSRHHHQKTPEPIIPEHCDSQEPSVAMDREVKQWCQAMKMIYFKSFVNVLFRSLQLKLPVHSYDINHAIEYCDNESPYDLEMEPFIKAVCPHMTRQQQDSLPAAESDHTELSASQPMLDIDLMKTLPSCLLVDNLHAMLQKKFSSVIGQKFKAVPSHSDLFFFCPPGLELGEVIRIGSRRRNETKSSESTSKHNQSGGEANLVKYKPDEEEDNKTVEFRSNVSSTSLKIPTKQESLTDTDAETGQRDYHSNFSSASNFENDWDSEDEEPTGESSDELSPPLFIQFSFTLSQGHEDIISVPVRRLPSCLAEIFQVEMGTNIILAIKR